MKKFKVEKSGFEGQRIDKFLVDVTDFSRSHIQDLISSGKVCVSGRKIKSHYVLHEGDVVVFDDAVCDAIVSLKSEELTADILYEDKNVLVLNKPAGVLVHPTKVKGGFDGMEGSITNMILSKISVADFEGSNRPGIVHRLDKDTSGCLIIAKNKASSDYMISQFKQRKVKKLYTALVSGILPHKEGLIDSPISHCASSRIKMQLADVGCGKQALTSYKVVNEFKLRDGFACSLLDIEILTGKTHQIRVHMAGIGHSVLGDATYGSKKMNKHFLVKLGLKRQFLHAMSVSFVGIDGKAVNVKAPLPADLDAVLKKLLVKL